MGVQLLLRKAYVYESNKIVAFCNTFATLADVAAKVAATVHGNKVPFQRSDDIPIMMGENHPHGVIGSVVADGFVVPSAIW